MMASKDVMETPADPRLAEELTEDDVIEMASLTRPKPVFWARFSSRRRWVGTGRG